VVDLKRQEFNLIIATTDSGVKDTFITKVQDTIVEQGSLIVINVIVLLLVSGFTMFNMVIKKQINILRNKKIFDIPEVYTILGRLQVKMDYDRTAIIQIDDNRVDVLFEYNQPYLSKISELVKGIDLSNYKLISTKLRENKFIYINGYQDNSGIEDLRDDIFTIRDEEWIIYRLSIRDDDTLKLLVIQYLKKTKQRKNISRMLDNVMEDIQRIEVLIGKHK
jgi:hypothetical protein